MRAWAIRARRAVATPLFWLFAETALFLVGWAYNGVIWGGLMWAFAGPAFFCGFLLFYGFAALATNWFQVLGLGAGMGAVFVFLAAMGEGIGPSGAQMTFFAPIVLMALARVIYLNLSPLWTPKPD